MSRPPEAFLLLCLLDGIDLPAIDAWLAAMNPSPNRDQLLQRRRRAEELFQANPDDADAWHAPLEFLVSAMVAAQQRKTLLPLARAGRTVNRARSEGGKAAAKAIRNENARRDAVLAKTGRALIASQDASARTVASLMVERGLSKGLGVKQLRAILKQTGVR